MLRVAEMRRTSALQKPRRHENLAELLAGAAKKTHAQ